MIGFKIGGELNHKVIARYGKQFLSILLFEGVTTFLLVTATVGLAGHFFLPEWKVSWALGLLLGAIASATAPAATVEVLREYKTRGPLTQTIHVDMLLAAMVLGVMVCNFAPRKSKNVFKLLDGFVPPVFVLFFVLVGAKLNLGALSFTVVILGTVYLVSRTGGKALGAYLGARFSNAHSAVRRYLPLCLLSQAGVPIDSIKQTLTRMVLSGLLLAYDIMEPVRAVAAPDAYIHDAKRLMNQHHLEYLIVTAEDGGVAGLIEERKLGKLISTRIIELQKHID